MNTTMIQKYNKMYNLIKVNVSSNRTMWIDDSKVFFSSWI